MLLLAAIFGAIIGSFLSVCIYRIPYGRVPEELNPVESETEQAQDSAAEVAESPNVEKISINSPPRSFCPHCRAQLRWYHNIPLISWIALRGRCAYCSARISVRYPLVELLSLSLSVLCLETFGATATALVIYLFCVSLLVISFIDYDFYIIPNVISIPGTVIGLVVAVVNQFTGYLAPPIVPDLWQALYGILAGGGFLFFVSEIYLRLRKKEGLGMGDVKLLAMTGAFFGVPGALYTIFLGSFLGSIIGVLLILLSGRKMSHQLPFGPYLALGTVVYLFVGADGLSQLIARLLGY